MRAAAVDQTTWAVEANPDIDGPEPAWLAKTIRVAAPMHDPYGISRRVVPLILLQIISSVVVVGSPRAFAEIVCYAMRAWKNYIETRNIKP